MNAKRVNAAAGVILAAQKQKNTAAGIAMALESAGLLQSPESAAELEQLRARVTELETSTAPRLCLCGHSRHAHTVPEPHSCFAFGQTCPCPTYRQLLPDQAWEQQKKNIAASEARAAEQAALEDPHDSPLHHTYETPRDLPTVCGCGHTARTHRPGGCIADAIHSGLLGLCGCTAEVTAL